MDKLQIVLTNIAAVVPPWVLQGLLTVVAAAIGSFGGAYLKTRGTNLATKADFATLQSQLRANTELTEEIKAEVRTTQQEWTNLRRFKLEALLNKLCECEEHLNEHRNDSMDGKVANVRELGPQLDTIQTIYFPELVNEVRSYLYIYYTAIRDGSSLAQALLEARSDENLKQRAREEYAATVTHLEFSTKRRVAVDELKSSTRKLLMEIMGVTQPSGRLRLEPSVAPPSSRQGDVANGDGNAERHSTGSKWLRGRSENEYDRGNLELLIIIGMALVITTILLFGS
jgi:hypothetical protein